MNTKDFTDLAKTPEGKMLLELGVFCSLFAPGHCFEYLLREYRKMFLNGNDDILSVIRQMLDIGMLEKAEYHILYMSETISGTIRGSVSPKEYEKILQQTGRLTNELVYYPYAEVPLLIIHTPEIFPFCNTSKLIQTEWIELLERRPQFIDQSAISDFQPKWSPFWDDNAECSKEDILHYGWDYLWIDDWVTLLEKKPQYKEQFNWRKKRLSLEAWAKIMPFFPEKKDKCPWHKFSKYEWAILASKTTLYDDIVPWITLQSGREGCHLLIHRPERMKNFVWKDLKRNDWTYLLAHAPQYVDKCPLKNFQAYNWEALISRQPMFFEKCPKKIAAEISWSDVILQMDDNPTAAESYPWDVFEKNKDLRFDFGSLSTKFPQYADRFSFLEYTQKSNTEKTSIAWADVLLYFPNYDSQCPWHTINRNIFFSKEYKVADSLEFEDHYERLRFFDNKPFGAFIHSVDSANGTFEGDDDYDFQLDIIS